jgi:hypothetical protein
MVRFWTKTKYVKTKAAKEFEFDISIKREFDLYLYEKSLYTKQRFQKKRILFPQHFLQGKIRKSHIVMLKATLSFFVCLESIYILLRPSSV